MASFIQYISHSQLDKKKWDNCIANADNGLIYATTLFLDTVAGNWDALVLDDYKAVMPLTWRKKYGIYYLAQPFFMAVSGVFGSEVTVDLIYLFLQAIPNKFKYWDIDLNESNPLKLPVSDSSLLITRRSNYLLPLAQQPELLTNNFKRLARRMISKARDNKLQILKNASPSVAISFYKVNYKKSHGLPEYAYCNLEIMLLEAQRQHKAHVYLAKLTSGETIAAYIVLSDHKYVYSVLGGSSKTGKDLGAFYLLTAEAITDFAGSEKVFRFEGSDLDGIAFFNEQFGGYPITYNHLKCNKLPFPLSLFKK